MKTLRMIAYYVRFNMMANMAYRSAFLMQAFGMLLNDAMLLFFWAVLFERFPAFQGWTLQGVMLIYGVLAGGYGWVVIIFGNLPHISRMINEGYIDYYLTLPADPLIHLLTSRSIQSGWGEIMFALGIYFVGHATPLRSFPLFIVICLLTGIIYASFSTIVGSLAFWIGRSENLAFQLRNALITFGLYPVDIFPGAIRVILYILIPAAFIGSLPAKLLLEFRWQDMLILTGAAICSASLARGVFYLGLRRYESGNLIISRG